MEKLVIKSENLVELTTQQLNNVSGGGFFKDLGYVIGTGLAYACKGLSAIKG